MSRIRQLADACPNADILACRVVEVSGMHTINLSTDFFDFACQAYLHAQLGINALDDASYNEAANHFTAAINSSAFSSEFAIHLKYEVFVVVR
jgi:hypothetical protein